MWIDASDEVPEHGRDVLCWLEDEFYEIGFHTGTQWRNYMHENILVTHWQPLPMPPTERKPSEPQRARQCKDCEHWKNQSVCNLPKSPKFTDITSATDGCTPNKKARADWI